MNMTTHITAATWGRSLHLASIKLQVNVMALHTVTLHGLEGLACYGKNAVISEELPLRCWQTQGEVSFIERSQTADTGKGALRMIQCVPLRNKMGVLSVGRVSSSPLYPWQLELLRTLADSIYWQLIATRNADQLAEYQQDCFDQAVAVEPHERNVATLSRMVRHLGHDLRDYLGNIKLALSSLQRQPTADRVSSTRMMMREIDRACEVIIDRVFLTRALSPTLYPASLKSIIMGALVDINLPDCMTVETDIDDAPTLLIDADLIGRLLLQLLQNSYNFTGVGTVSITCKTLPATEENEPDQALIIVEDSGPGIPDDFREKALLPGYTTDRMSSGLGLTVTNRIVQCHQGTLTLGSSERLGGLKVKVTIPICPG